MIQPSSDPLPHPLLRPEFTHSLAARLLQGARINLTAPHGLGRRRTVQDLRTLLPPDMLVLYADIKLCADDFAGTLRDLCVQAALQDGDISHLGQLIEALGETRKAALLILHNVDLLRDAPHDRLFDTALLPSLAHIAAYPQLALLTVSETIHPDWPLPCEHLPLPPQDYPIAHM